MTLYVHFVFIHSIFSTMQTTLLLKHYNVIDKPTVYHFHGYRCGEDGCGNDIFPPCPIYHVWL